MAGIIQQLSKTLPGGLTAVAPVNRPAVIAEKDPLLFWARLLGALKDQCPVALADPAWPTAWIQETEALLAREAPPGESILIPTSGSTGRPKFCIHNIGTLMAAAEAYRERFAGIGLIHSINILPPHHIGGLMPVFRSLACGGQARFTDYRNLAGAGEAPFPLSQCSLSLVPTQLGRLLHMEKDTAVLKRFGMVLVGGAACPAPVLETARLSGLRLAPCYGSTETAAMVTVLNPDAFLSGNTTVGHPLPGMDLLPDPAGCLEVRSASVCHGYYPDETYFQRKPYRTNDIGEWTPEGLRIHGRADRMIISGGKNIHPEQVETAAMATGLAVDAACAGVDDPDWGQRVELSFIPMQGVDDVAARMDTALRKRLPAYAVPKNYHLVADLNRGPLGKAPGTT